MNQVVEGAVIQRETFSRPEERALPTVQVPSNMTPMQMVAMAVANGEPTERLEKLMELQERFEANEARKAFNEAFAKFKAEVIVIVKNRTVDAGPLKDKKYAELFSVVNAVTPALSKHGLSAAWRLTKDEKEWIEVTCTIKHSLGHSESVAMGGPPDAGGAKSAMQARASTVSYLERYTLKAICGVAEQGDDKDGAGTPEGMDEITLAGYAAKMNEAKDLDTLKAVFEQAYPAAEKLKDKDAMRAIIRAKNARYKALGGKA